MTIELRGETESATGPVRRWLDDDGILHAKNDFCSLTWAPTDDHEQVGKLGWHGSEQICVEFMLRKDFEALVDRFRLP